MKGHRTIALAALVGAAFGIFAASAAAIGTNMAWTEAKAERVVVRDATVRLSPMQRGPLEQQLLGSVRQWSALELGAQNDGNARVAARAHSLAYRYSTLLAKVREGLDLEQASCSGYGQAVAGGRFTRFRCHVTSESLLIPSAQAVVSADGEIADIVEGAPQAIDPVVAWLMVRTTGKSAISYRQPLGLLAES